MGVPVCCLALDFTRCDRGSAAFTKEETPLMTTSTVPGGIVVFEGLENRAKKCGSV